jgi:Tfp pilus assembly protein FimT
MNILEFALMTLVILALFLAFALAVTVALLGSRDAQAATTKLFGSFAKWLGGLLRR